MRYLKPVYINDTIYAVCEVVGKKEKDERYGVIQFLMKAVNQDGNVCSGASGACSCCAAEKSSTRWSGLRPGGEAAGEV